MDDLRLDDYRVQIDPQCGADSIVSDVDIDAVLMDVADNADIGGITLKVAARPQPPEVVALLQKLCKLHRIA